MQDSPQATDASITATQRGVRGCIGHTEDYNDDDGKLKAMLAMARQDGSISSNEDLDVQDVEPIAANISSN